MSYPLVFHIPMKFSLELMTSVCSYRVYSKWETFNYITYKVNGTLLVMFFIDFQSPYSCGIINRCVLIPFSFLTIISIKKLKTEHPFEYDAQVKF